MENGLFNSSLDSIVKKMDKKWEKMYGTDGAKKKKDSGIALNTTGATNASTKTRTRTMMENLVAIVERRATSKRTAEVKREI